MAKKAEATAEVSPLNGSPVPAVVPQPDPTHDIAGIKHALGTLVVGVNDLTNVVRDLQLASGYRANDAQAQAAEYVATRPVPQAIVDALKKPFPKEALSTIEGGQLKGMTSIKSAYITERLNDVFGVNGWFLTDETITVTNEKTSEKKGVMVVSKCTLTVPEYNIVRQAYGGNDNSDLGNAYKGAVSDALSKICSMIYIGQDVYKGNGESAAAKAKAAELKPAASAPKAAAAPVPAPTPVRAVSEPAAAVQAPAPATPAEAPAEPQAEPKPAAEAKTSGGSITCTDCTRPVTEFQIKDTLYSVEQLTANSQRKYKCNLCAECQKARAAKTAAAGGNRVGNAA